MTRKEILAEAEKCVCSDRNLQYGEPEDNFNTIAEFWSTFLGIRIAAPQVAAMMILLKTARIKSRCWEEMVKGDRATVRSKTFTGIARAMAEQWGK